MRIGLNPWNHNKQDGFVGDGGVGGVVLVYHPILKKPIQYLRGGNPEKPIQKNYPRHPRVFFIPVFSLKLFSVRFIAFVFLMLSCPAWGQVTVHPTQGLGPWFKSWYLESKKMAKKTRVRGVMDKEVVKLYLAVVNGKKTESGAIEGVSRAIFPTGRYSVISPGLTYAVIPAFPTEPEQEFAGVAINWSGLYDAYLHNDSVQKRSWDSFVIDPDKYRVPGLVLTQERMREISSYLEKDIKADSAQTGIYPDRPVRGESWKMMGGWINLMEPHWRNRWIFRSFPSAWGILIDRARTQVVLKYSIHNGSGVARYKKEKGEWVLVESRINIMQ